MPEYLRGWRMCGRLEQLEDQMSCIQIFTRFSHGPDCVFQFHMMFNQRGGSTKSALKFITPIYYPVLLIYI
jgi:hypothetical protein